MYVKPHLKYCIQFWIPSNIKDANILKGVQRRATKMIPSLRNFSYNKRLKRLGMFYLRLRRLRNNLIEVFKMIHGIDKINIGKLFDATIFSILIIVVHISLEGIW